MQVHSEAPGKRRLKRKCEDSADPGPEVKRRCRKIVEDSVKEKAPVVKRRRSRLVRGRHSRDNVEERKFAEMVVKYRQKMENS